MDRDRGIIKWAPFDALVGFSNLLNELKYNRKKAEKPILSDDQKAIMDQNITYAKEFNQEVTIVYFQDGYFKEVFGKIKKIDQIKQMIILENQIKIKLNSVLDLKIDKVFLD